ncbi:hypothetical protein LG943_00245 [Streptomonospora sp. S1-112]|uniref:Uncharacterized protein n=1 Tax=Streptomonospora mangrovi TaxID=2883123 RepID=A0A9X3NRI0_9ACTN|nr:hypothetical protein [Streptomonospora mangrovi]MDA0562776.1 hypothetical protein [Streptomonospora mangrovi]
MESWPPRDTLGRILMDLAGLKIIEYHSIEDTPDGRLHHITTAHGYEVALTDGDITPFALGAGAAEFNLTHTYNAASDVIDEAVSRRWRR